MVLLERPTTVKNVEPSFQATTRKVKKLKRKEKKKKKTLGRTVVKEAVTTFHHRENTVSQKIKTHAVSRARVRGGGRGMVKDDNGNGLHLNIG